MSSSLTELLSHRVAVGADAPALIYGERRMSQGDLAEESRRVAQGLAELGIGPGDRVALWLPNVPAWLACFFACAQIGAVVVTVNTRFKSSEVSDIVGASPGHLSEIERGIKGPSLELAVKITQLFPTVQLATLVRSAVA